MSRHEVAAEVQRDRLCRSFYRAEARVEARRPDWDRPEPDCSDEAYDAMLDRLLGAREDQQR